MHRSEKLGAVIDRIGDPVSQRERYGGLRPLFRRCHDRFLGNERIEMSRSLEELAQHQLDKEMVGRRISLAASLETALAERDAYRADRDAHRADRDAHRVELDRCPFELRRAHAELEKLPGILASLDATEHRLAALETDWDNLRTSQSWRAYRQLIRVGSRIAPVGTRRRAAVKWVARLVECLAIEGVVRFARRQARQALERKTQHS